MKLKTIMHSHNTAVHIKYCHNDISNAGVIALFEIDVKSTN